MSKQRKIREGRLQIRACQSPEPVAKTLPAGLRSIEITGPEELSASG